MKKVISTILILLLIIHLAPAQKTIVQGKVINDSKNVKVIWLRNLLQKKDVAKDSVGPDGSFKLEFDLQSPDYFALMVNDKNYIMLVLQPGDKVNVIYDAKVPGNSQISGSPLTDVLEQARQADAQINEERKKYEEKLQVKQRELYNQIILNNLGKISTILLAEKLPLEDYYDTHEKLAKSLEKYASNPYVNQYINNVKSYGKTRIGTVAPDIALPDPKGDTIRLSQTRGKYVLVDFWASWCRPCRVESPNLVKAYEKYHDKGFTIYSVSLDRSKQAWIKAIEADNLDKWYHVSDLRGWQSSAANLYGVTGIPANFLLDPQGRIIAKNLRGKKLEQKLAEIFGKK